MKIFLALVAFGAAQETDVFERLDWGDEDTEKVVKKPSSIFSHDHEWDTAVT